VKLMPDPIDLGSSVKFTIGNIALHSQDYKKDPKGFPVTERMVMGYPLPAWQRPIKWSEAQQTRFIESAWLGIPIGFYVANEFDWNADGSPLAMSGLLIDGQQRFYSLERYFSDEFPVFGYLWSEVSKAEHRRFLNKPFPSYSTSLGTEEQARDLYNRLNFGGTQHEDHERA
jgi:hypothetical protein